MVVLHWKQGLSCAKQLLPEEIRCGGKVDDPVNMAGVAGDVSSGLLLILDILCWLIRSRMLDPLVIPIPEMDKN